MSRTRFFVWGAIAALSVGASMACAPSSSFSQHEDAGVGPDGSMGGGGGGDYEDPDTFDAGLDPDSACAAEGAKATLTRTPVDVVLVVDNSGSMRPQIASVQEILNAHFAKVLDNHKLDYRVIVISKHGDIASPSDHAPICIEAPLSGIPSGGCGNPPPEPVNTSRFFHYSARVRKNDAVQVMFGGFEKADELGRAPKGWSEWLRPGAFTSILVLTDGRIEMALDGVNYTDGNASKHASELAPILDAKLRTLSPEHFGKLGEERNYRWYSVVGMAPNEPPNEPYPASAPLVTDTCSSGNANAGLGYQALSRLTEATRFPVCNPSAFDAIFRAIAKDLIQGSPVDCEFPIPEPPPGEKLDLGRVAVQYTPSNAGDVVLFGPVENEGDCVPNAFYVESETVHLCPEACELVQSDDSAKVGVLFDCVVTVR